MLTNITVETIQGTYRVLVASHVGGGHNKRLFSETRIYPGHSLWFVVEHSGVKHETQNLGEAIRYYNQVS